MARISDWNCCLLGVDRDRPSSKQTFHAIADGRPLDDPFGGWLEQRE